MELPVRIVGARPTEPVLAVDGALGAPGLELSHWPGHATPERFRHDLSTGCALIFAGLEADERRRLAAGCTAIVNNHYDTDGVCALFAARHPEAARARSEGLLAAAACGDFYRLPDERSHALDVLVGALADPAVSPLDFTDPASPDGAPLEDRARHEVAVHHLLETLPALLDGDLVPHRALWEPEVTRTRDEVATLAAAQRRDDPELDLVVRLHDGADFTPGRHALFGSAAADRQLVACAAPGGTTYRFVLSTLSWFDLVSAPRRPRPDLGALAAQLNALEGTAEDDRVRWHTQGTTNASPELWFGEAGVASFAERNPGLAPSTLGTGVVRDTIRAALAAGEGATG